MKRTTYLRNRFLLPGAVLILLVLLWSMTGCQGEASSHQENEQHEGHDHEEGEEHEGHDHEEGEHGEAESGIIRVSPTTMAEANIRIAPVTQSSVRGRFSLPAVVAPHGDGMARVGTIVPGRVATLFAAEGTFVAKGARLAEIETMEIGEARAEYVAAIAREKRARQGMDRQQRLTGEGIGAQRTLEESTAEFEAAQAERREAEAHLTSLGLDPKEVATASSFTNRFVVRSPIAGMVSRRNATLGEHINPDDDLFTLINTGTVWIDAHGTPAQAALLGVGSTAFARTPSGERVAGRIIFISPTVDPESKTVTIRLEIPNRQGTFRPGGFTTAEFESGGTRSMLAIPDEAVETEGNRSFVYRVHEPGSFERVEVEVLEKRENSVIINAGLQEGDQIAQSGIFYLRSIRMQGELSEHHH